MNKAIGPKQTWKFYYRWVDKMWRCWGGGGCRGGGRGLGGRDAEFVKPNTGPSIKHTWGFSDCFACLAGALPGRVHGQTPTKETFYLTNPSRRKLANGWRFTEAFPSSIARAGYVHVRLSSFRKRMPVWEKRNKSVHVYVIFGVSAMWRFCSHAEDSRVSVYNGHACDSTIKTTVPKTRTCTALQ